MSKIFVDQVDPKTATTLTLGTSGDTVSIPSGVTIANSGTATGFGVSLANGVDNRVVTSSSATALNGEANLKFDGATLTAIGDNGTTGLSPHGTYDNIVIDDNGSSGLTYLGSTTANQQIRFDDSGGNRGVISYNHDGDTMSFGTAGADRALITSTGILGLGAGNASADLGVGLHVKTADSGASAHAGSDEVVIEGSGDAGLSILSGTSGDGTIRFGDSGDNQIGRVAYSHSTNILSLWAGGTDRLSVDADAGGGSMAINGTRFDDWYRVQMRWNGSNYGAIVLDNSETDSNEANYLNFKEGNTSIGGITKDGTSAAILFTTTSDYRLKENVTDKTDGIEKIKLLKPKKFSWKGDASNQIKDGFLAHEVQEVVPGAVTGAKDAIEKYKEGEELPEGKSVGDNKLDENGNTIINPQGIDKSSLVPLLTSALQEAITKIETLETKVTALENA